MYLFFFRTCLNNFGSMSAKTDTSWKDAGLDCLVLPEFLDPPKPCSNDALEKPSNGETANIERSQEAKPENGNDIQVGAAAEKDCFGTGS